jgi:hypothetical protein
MRASVARTEAAVTTGYGEDLRKCGGEGDVVGAGLMRVEEERRRAARRSVTVAA